MVVMQEFIWQIKPDLIIETGIAQGGSLIMSVSMLSILLALISLETPLPFDRNFRHCYETLRTRCVRNKLSVGIFEKFLRDTHIAHRSISYGFFNDLILKGKWQCKSCWNDAQVKETVG
jgi:hypothetical protein